VTTAAVQDTVRELGARGASARIVGAGGWLDAGRPVRDAAPLSVTSDRGIVEYVAGDLTLTARAGATLGDIAAVTAAEGQWLALDPFGGSDGTLGATVATGSAGPLATSFGTPRDTVLGMEVVTGNGEIVRAGGRVVKNVAGFDLTRLFTGAWGTLAVITEVTVRLRARPERDETIALAIPDDASLESWLARLRAFPFTPLALEMLSAPLSARLGLENRGLMLARLGGNDDAVRAQRQLIGAIGEPRDVATAVWSALGSIEFELAAPLAVARVSAPPSSLHALWPALTRDDSALAHATVGRGVVRSICASAGGNSLSEWLSRIARCEGTHIFERLPAPAWREVPCRVNDPISRAVRAAFDPAHLLNPGILGEAA
jgi:glycolate oxidase FAD binding subunit